MIVWVGFIWKLKRILIRSRYPLIGICVFKKTKGNDREDIEYVSVATIDSNVTPASPTAHSMEPF